MNQENKKGRGRPKKNSHIEKKVEITQEDVKETTVKFNSTEEEQINNPSETMEQNSNQNINSSSSNVNADIDEKLSSEIDFSSDKGFNDIPDDEPDILGESTVKRSYAQGDSNGNTFNQQQNGGINTGGVSEEPIPEPIYQNVTQKPQIDEETARNLGLQNDIPANEFNNQGGQNSSGQAQQAQQEVKSNLQELSPNEKRDAVEKSADAFLDLYCNYFPLPFVHFSSHNIKKIKKLEKEGLIDLNAPVKRDGTTVQEWIEGHNEKVMNAFTVSDATRASIREPLIDVLMEKEIALTPTQRLLLAVGQHVVGSVMQTVQLINQKKEDLEVMKEMHAEKMEAMNRAEESRMNEIRRQQEMERERERQREERINQANAERERVERESKKQEEQIKENAGKSQVAEKVDENNTEPTMDDALNATDADSKTTTTTNDIPE